MTHEETGSRSTGSHEDASATGRPPDTQGSPESKTAGTWLEKFRTALEAAEQAVFITDSSGAIEYVNTAYLEQTGADRAAVEGTTPGILDRQGLDDGLATQRKPIEPGETWREEIIRERTDGEGYVARQAVTPVFDGENVLEGFVGIQEDMSVEFEPGPTSRIEHQYFEQAQSLADVGVWYLDIATGEIEWSDEVYRIFERPMGTTVEYDDFMEYVHPADRELVEARWESAKAGQPYEVTHRVLIDGKTKWVQQQAVVEFDEVGEPVGGMGVVQDVTEQREREQLLQVTDRLLRHNLRNDLTVIRGNASRIRETADESLAESAESIIETSDALLQMGRKARMIGEVVERDIPTVDIDVVAVLAEKATQLEERYPTASIVVDRSMRPEIRAIPQIEAAFLEVIENAIVHNDRSEPRVEIRLVTEPDRVRIEIADDGPPIPEIERSIVTHGRATDQVNHGSGLGLWMVHWIVHRSRGALGFAVKEPRGNVVSITLERRRRDGDAPQEE